MTRTLITSTFTTTCLLLGTLLVLPAAAQDAPFAFSKATLTIDGTSNVHDWSASTTRIRVTHAKLAAEAGGPSFWDAVVKPGAIEAFDVTIPATTLTSPRSGLDKNMYKALKTDQHPDIVFGLEIAQQFFAFGHSVSCLYFKKRPMKPGAGCPTASRSAITAFVS